jgi:hypothetical protein
MSDSDFSRRVVEALGENMGVLAPAIKQLMAEAWLEGHEAGRDYQGSGWNSDAHNPQADNPYSGAAR